MLDSLLPAQSQRASLTARATKYAASVDLAASYLAARGIDRLDAISSLLGVVSEPEPMDERFAGMLCIPYVTAKKDVIALKFRRMDDGTPKYDSPAGQKQHLYNARALVAGGDVAAILEGELACIIAEKVLGIPCVGTPGTQWLPHWSRCFSDFERVLVIADNDLKDDGSNPGRKHAEKLVKQVPNAELVLPPAGTDFDEWVLADGADTVRARVLGSKPAEELIPY